MDALTAMKQALTALEAIGKFPRSQEDLREAIAELEKRYEPVGVTDKTGVAWIAGVPEGTKLYAAVPSPPTFRSL